MTPTTKTRTSLRAGSPGLPVIARVIAFGALLIASACGQGLDQPASAEVEGGGPGDVAGSGLLGVPVDDALDPFAVQVGGVHIVEESATSPHPAHQPIGGREAAADDEQPCRKLVFDGPTFASNGIVLSADGREALDRLLTTLTEQACDTDGRPCRHEDVLVNLVGHTDDQPTSVPGGNARLSKDRARAVAAVFVEYGFIDVHAYGKADTEPAPALSPDTRTIDEIRAANRRVTIEIHCR